MTRRYIRHVVAVWQCWQARRKLNRAIPILADLDRQLAEYRRQHKPGAARIIRAKRAAIHAAMGRR